ncbi:hypothetical protein GF325_08075 [Candidatus Bathyarchaeota archaeon]|nr:hypothetical protein [Candidatus Bathyarchaeota archaeon]
MVDSNIKRIVLDVLKPHEPELWYLAKELANMPSEVGISGVNITLMEIDARTESIKVTVEGQNLVYDIIKEKMREMNCAIHSIDQVIAGKKIVEEVHVPDLD